MAVEVTTDSGGKQGKASLIDGNQKMYERLGDKDYMDKNGNVVGRLATRDGKMVLNPVADLGQLEKVNGGYKFKGSLIEDTLSVVGGSEGALVRFGKDMLLAKSANGKPYFLKATNGFDKAELTESNYFFDTAQGDDLRPFLRDYDEANVSKQRMGELIALETRLKNTADPKAFQALNQEINVLKAKIALASVVAIDAKRLEINMVETMIEKREL